MAISKEIGSPLPVHYWRQYFDEEGQNYGDFLTELLLQKLFVAPFQPADAYRLIGSVISDSMITGSLREVGVDLSIGKVAFWGCGLRSEDSLSSKFRKNALFFGVRGKRSRDALGLPLGTPLGDPGLLLPVLHPCHQYHGESICVTHIHEPRDLVDIRSQTGVDAVVSAKISSSQQALLAMINRISGASFVLAGALHAAITACAYGVPFAFYDSGTINLPFKWEDFASSVQIPSLFARDLSEARTIYDEVISDSLVLPPMSSMLLVAPFSVHRMPLLKCLLKDGLLDEADYASIVCSV